ncbi:MAG: Fic family protein [Oscillospiraceae bacterium]|jgi:Fic family protein|nr:Fic family protein [Oscillospiraceae bacterium]
MKDYDYSELPRNLLTDDVAALLAELNQYRGEPTHWLGVHADVLTHLAEAAKIQSTDASNRIEGIRTTDKRLTALMREQITPRDRPEQEIAGYRDVLNLIQESYEAIAPRANVILQLHRKLYDYSASGIGGRYKHADNYIQETDEQGNAFIRFQPVPAYLVAEAMERLCDAFGKAVAEKVHDLLLLIPMFILDFLCIHPFHDGNGRMSRLLTLLLLLRSGHFVGQYISVEALIEKSKETYYETLQASSVGWHDNANDYLPFARYMLGLLLKAYRMLQERVALREQAGARKCDCVRAAVDQHLGFITAKDILARCPNVSESTVERTLKALVQEGVLVKKEAGVYAKSEGLLG